MPSEAHGPRLRDPLSWEREAWGRGLFHVAGVDEAGRGPLAGPVVAAAVVLEPGAIVEGAGDSKRIPTHRREALAREIRHVARSVGVGAASVREIDALNILEATTLAMRRALAALDPPPELVVVDGRPVRGLGWDHEAVTGGDGLVHCIGCASIIAKVCRDRLMRQLASRYPAYGWARNAGYGTAEHLEALRRFGPSPHHRLSFAGVQLDLGLGG